MRQAEEGIGDIGKGIGLMKSDQFFRLTRPIAAIASAILAVLMGIFVLANVVRQLFFEAPPGSHESIWIPFIVGVAFASVFLSAGILALWKKAITFLVVVWIFGTCLALVQPLGHLSIDSVVEKITFVKIAHEMLADTPLAICLIGLLLIVLSKLGRAHEPASVTKE